MTLLSKALSRAPPREDEDVVEFSNVSLDELWRKAAALGRIKVDWGVGRPTVYEVSIMFERKSGSRVYATGKDQNILFAFEEAIKEAYELGAR